jgi:DNA (cytosine-5)-methyltransferase 1
MKHLGLFEGIGGFSLAARWMGWETVAWVEINEFCQKVLKKNFPEAKGYGDIKEFDGTKYRGTIDILTGGFPCQPYSSSGKRKGKGDERHLWPEMLRVVREIRPSFIVGENVYGLITWNKGLVFEEVHTDLEAEGYEVQSFILPAAGVNAPHKRDRIWFVAHSISKHFPISIQQWRQGKADNSNTDWQGNTRTITDSKDNGCQRQNGSSNRQERRVVSEGFVKRRESVRCGETIIGCWEDFPTQSPVRRRDDGIPNRVDRIKSLGNAIVPQVALEIFKAIEAVNDPY